MLVIVLNVVVRSQFVAVEGSHVGENDDIRNKERRAEQHTASQPAQRRAAPPLHCTTAALSVCCQGSQILLHLENNFSKNTFYFTLVHF